MSVLSGRACESPWVESSVGHGDPAVIKLVHHGPPSAVRPARYFRWQTRLPLQTLKNIVQLDSPDRSPLVSKINIHDRSSDPTCCRRRRPPLSRSATTRPLVRSTARFRPALVDRAVCSRSCWKNHWLLYPLSMVNRVVLFCVEGRSAVPLASKGRVGCFTRVHVYDQPYVLRLRGFYVSVRGAEETCVWLRRQQ